MNIIFVPEAKDEFLDAILTTRTRGRALGSDSRMRRIGAFFGWLSISALQRDDLRARVVAHKQVFFSAICSHTETAVPGTFRIMPQKERAEVLARDYAEMRDMFFQEPPPWNEILDVLAALEMRINSASRVT